MGKPIDLVVEGRLVRLCCNMCKKSFAKDPAWNCFTGRATYPTVATAAPSHPPEDGAEAA